MDIYLYVGKDPDVVMLAQAVKQLAVGLEGTPHSPRNYCHEAESIADSIIFRASKDNK